MIRYIQKFIYKGKILFCFLCLALFFISCGRREIPDGKYDAKVEYYNPKTGAKSTYTLPIEVENNELIRIYWSNGGWLDETHFQAPNISNGTASFTDDRGRKYRVKIIYN